MNSIKFLLIFALILLFARSANAQQVIDARSAGMAFSNSADTRGLAQVGLNPATLALHNKYTFEMNLASFNLSIFSNGLSKGIYDQYFTKGVTLNNDDKEHILNSIPGTGFAGTLSAKMKALAFYIPNFSMALSGVGSGNIQLPREIMELALYGNSDLDRSYDFFNLSGSAWAGAAASVSLSHRFRLSKRSYFDYVALGITGKYFSGLAYFEIIDSRGKFQNVGFEHDSMQLDGMIMARTARGGNGKGFDFGAVLHTRSQWTFGFAVLNMIGSINWNGQTEMREFSVESDSLSVSSGGISEDMIIDRDTSYAIGSFSTRLPAVIDFGVAYRGWNRWTFSAEFEKGMSENLGGSKKSRLAVGMEFTGIPLIPLRSGVSFGGQTGFSFAFGTGLDLHFWHVDVAVINHGGFSQKNSHGITLAATTKLRF
ncbi:MAG TPA: hypothetical protein ENK14_01880 [Caldithrix sp.]|nr:hypothetical protein [Caldithrix sp.]